VCLVWVFRLARWEIVVPARYRVVPSCAAQNKVWRPAAVLVVFFVTACGIARFFGATIQWAPPVFAAFLFRYDVLLFVWSRTHHGGGRFRMARGDRIPAVGVRRPCLFASLFCPSIVVGLA